jgi:putative ABC transport system ATP-binding protein
LKLRFNVSRESHSLFPNISLCCSSRSTSEMSCWSENPFPLLKMDRTMGRFQPEVHMADFLNGVGITKIYPLGKTEVPALRGVDVTVQQREFTVFAGPSGSGKTTLLNICGLIDSVSGGKLFFNGSAVTGLPDHKLVDIRRRSIGFVFQNFNLVPVQTAYENVEFPLLLLNVRSGQRREMVEKYLKRVGLWDRRRHKPAQLSGGEQQRVAIARALVKQPKLVIADEPTANLDSQNTRAIIELMDSLNREEGITFIVASHDPIVIQAAHRVLHMRDGLIDGHGAEN